MTVIRDRWVETVLVAAQQEWEFEAPAKKGYVIYN